MKIKNVTFVPNEIFDIYLSKLSLSELKVLLVIIRQTMGWSNGKKCHAIDWISVSFFQRKTNLCRKSISMAIDGLQVKNLIYVFNGNGTLMVNAIDRRRCRRLYFTYAPFYKSMKIHQTVKNMRIKC